MNVKVRQAVGVRFSLVSSAMFWFWMSASALWVGLGGCNVDELPPSDGLTVCVVEAMTEGMDGADGMDGGGMDGDGADSQACATVLFAVEAERLPLRARATGGSGPYVYRWNIEVIPDDPEDDFDGAILPIPDNVGEEILSIPLDQGRHVYRVLVTDATGRTAADFVEISVSATPLTVEIAEAPEDEDEVLTVLVGEEFTLTAEPSEEEVTYEWGAGGDVFASLEGDTLRAVSVRFEEAGEASISVRVTHEEDGRRGTSTIQLNVLSSVAVDRPDFLAANTPVVLTSRVEHTGLSDLTYLWDIKSRNGDDLTLTPREAPATTLTVRSLDTYEMQLIATGTFEGEPVQIIRAFALSSIESDRVRLVMDIASETEGVTGSVVFELFADSAPKTVGNMLRYVDAEFYTDILWHRVAQTSLGEPFVVQCGGFFRGEGFVERKDATHSPVMGEPNNGLSNQPGTIAMALFGNNPDSGTTQFFVNQNDNASLDEDFTVFGEVVSGIEVFDAMAEVERTTAAVEGGGTISDVPREDIVITSFRREGTAPISDEPLLGASGIEER